MDGVEIYLKDAKGNRLVFENPQSDWSMNFLTVVKIKPGGKVSMSCLLTDIFWFGPNVSMNDPIHPKYYRFCFDIRKISSLMLQGKALM